MIDGEIDGILVDAYTAGSNREDFQRPNLRPTKMLKYPRTYGFVVSGDLKNVANAMRDFIRINEKRILDSLSMNTHLMEVKAVVYLLYRLYTPLHNTHVKRFSQEYQKMVLFGEFIWPLKQMSL